MCYNKRNDRDNRKSTDPEIGVATAYNDVRYDVVMSEMMNVLFNKKLWYAATMTSGDRHQGILTAFL